MQLTISTHDTRQLIDITDEVAQSVPTEGMGILQIFVKHTTCALTTIDADPDIDLDLFDFLDGITPQKKWRHPHNPAHLPDHILSSLIGPSVQIPYENGQLQLGSWQRIILIELNGPRRRQVVITIIKGA